MILSLPDICLALAKNLVVFDHRHHTIKVVSCVYLAKGDSREDKDQEIQGRPKETLMP